MNGNYHMTARVEFGSRPRWIVSRDNASLKPTAGARVVDLRGSFANGQLLAGTGALVFEGETLTERVN